MATLGNTYGTNLVDLNKHREGAEQGEVLINMLEETHELFKDMTWKTCNSGATHRTSIVTKLPEAHMRRLYRGFKMSKGGRAQISEDTGMAGTSFAIDYKEYELEGKSANWLAQNSSEGTEALSNMIANEMFYGDRDKDPESINGLCKRLGVANGTNKLKASYNVISALSSKPTGPLPSDFTSIYAVGHGDKGFFGLVPKNGSSVIKQTVVGEDGKHFEDDSEGNKYPALFMTLDMDFGCCLHDFRYAARLCNIPLSQLDPAQEGGAQIDLWDKLTRLYHKIRKYKNGARWAFYVNSDLFTYLDLQAQKKVSPTLTYQTIDGKEILAFRGIPIKEDEAIKIGETWVPFEK